MGISGLLPLLKSIHNECDLKKFAGKTIGVDAYGWLHRGTVSCAIDLALGKPTHKYVDFCMNRVRMLIHFGITPYLVFDGDYLPSKAGTEKERAARRTESRRAGLELLKLGKTSQAHLELQKAVDVTPEMARLLIEELKFHNVQYVVAPYEADSQLAYLERKGIINGILSEDSDLLVFGAKSLITKLDQYGACVEINRSRFTACREISLVGWTDADFRRMAILSGCDYLPSIPKMGLKTAYRLLRKHKTVERVVRAAQFEGQFKVPQGYLESFMQAEKTFLYQWVFCPLSKKVVNCTDPEPGVDPNELPYIGKFVPDDVAIGVANGNLNPHTKEPIVVPSKDRPHTKPLRPQARGTTTEQTPDLKHTKSIDSFFKPKRTPLAELDVNLFTPSPSQQVLIESHHNRRWTSSMAPPSQPQLFSVPRTAPPPRRTVSEYRPASATVARTAPASAAAVRARTTGSSGASDSPSKRRRLCSDAGMATPDGSSTAGDSVRSHFFGSAGPDPSPSVRPAKKKKKQNSEFDLWDDDSLEEAMAQFVDLEEAASSPKKKLRVFSDGQRLSINSQSSSCSRSSLGSSQDSQETSGVNTPATSMGSPGPEPEEQDFGAAVAAGAKLREKYSYGEAKKSPSRSLATVRSPRNKLLARTSSAPASSQVLQSMRQSSQTVVPSKLSFTTNQGDVVSSPIAEKTDLEDSAWASMEAQVIVPATPSPQKKLQVQGSEDFLVPDSEEESEVTESVKKALNLGQYAFTGN